MKHCPRCGSKHLNYLPWLGEIYECRECGYRGALVIEDEDREAVEDEDMAEDGDGDGDGCM